MWDGIDDAWTSRVISPALLDAAWGDRSLWADLGPRISGFDSNALVGARAWAAAERVAMVHQATGDLGVPAHAFESIANALGSLIIRPPRDVDVLIDQLTSAAIGIAVEALASIPVVGPIARAIGAMALMLRDLSRKPQDQAREHLPPPQGYDRNAEEYVMNTQLLPALTTNDWTRLFMPRVGNDPRVVELDTGWMLTAHDGGNGLGFIPGTQQINSFTQAFLVQEIEPRERLPGVAPGHRRLLSGPGPAHDGNRPTGPAPRARAVVRGSGRDPPCVEGARRCHPAVCLRAVLRPRPSRHGQGSAQ